MKIAWFSPLPPQPSGISEYSVAIVEELKKYSQVDLWTEGEVDWSLFPQNIVNRYDHYPYEKTIKILGEYDAVIYNMGNNHMYHTHMFEILKRFPGIVILHDYVMHHFFLGYYQDVRQSLDSYFNMVRSYYGYDAEVIIRQAISEGRGIHEDERVINYPLCEPIILRAIGIVTHTNFAKVRTERWALCPVRRISHPLLKTHIAEDNFIFERDKIYIFVGGEITPNKLVDRIILAFANYKFLSRIKDRVRILIVGNDKTGKIKSLIEESKAPGIFIFVGRKEEALFNYYIKNSHICINLRYPTMGESSGVLLRCLQFGKPTIVTKVGFYDEIPDDAVIKINYGEEYKIPYIVEDYIESINKYSDVSIKARAYVEREHSMSNYISKLLDFIEESRRFKPFYEVFKQCTNEISNVINCEYNIFYQNFIDELSDIYSILYPKNA